MDTMSVNGKAFTVIKLLGKGKGGYSYLVSDGEHNYVLKTDSPRAVFILYLR